MDGETAIPTEDERQAIVRLFADVPDDAVIEFAKANPAYLKGARAARASLGIIRMAIQARLRSARPIDEPLRQLLAAHSLQQQFVVVFSEAALELARDDLAVYFHDAHFAAALLLDERPAVRKLGSACLQSPGPGSAAPTDEERQEAARALEATFAHALGHLAGLRAEAGAVEPAGGRGARAEAERLRGELRELREAHERERNRAERRYEAASEESVALRGRLAALERELQDAATRMRAAVAEKAAADGALRELRERFDQDVSARVQAEFAEGVRSWLGPAEALEQAAREAAAARECETGIVARVQSALKRQEAADRQYGNRAELQRHLQTLVDAQAELALARRDALRPLPDLAELAAGLELEIAAVRERLALPVVNDGLQEMLARINAVDTIERLGQFRQLLEDAADLEAWSPADQRTLYQKLDHQFGRLLDRHVTRFAQRPAWATPLSALRDALRADQDLVLYVDGHNLLPELYAHLYENGQPGRRAYDALAAALVRLLEGTVAPRVRLYFDGPERTVTMVSPQVERIFSGGKGRNRADDAILEDLDFRARAGSSTARYLVSSDRDFVRQAREHGVTVMRSPEFAVLLR